MGCLHAVLFIINSVAASFVFGLLLFDFIICSLFLFAILLVVVRVIWTCLVMPVARVFCGYSSGCCLVGVFACFVLSCVCDCVTSLIVSI